jgi:regulator of protease activity HflC (stomatin/prohibitin superfamily)
MRSAVSKRLSGPYRSVVVALCAITALGAVGAVALALLELYALDAVVVLGIATGTLFAITRATRSAVADAGTSSWRARLKRRLRAERVVACVGLGLVAIDVAAGSFSRGETSLRATIVASACCVLATGTAALAAYYFRGADVAQLPEAPALQRGARVVAWLFAMVAAEVWASRLGYVAALWSLHVAILAVAVVACIELLFSTGFELRVVAALGGRANLFASLLDTAQHELGIDLRSTWALAVVRRFARPLVLGLCVLGWLSTSMTIINANEVGLVERFGASLEAPPLLPGIHVHWPWPVDRIQRISTSRIRTVPVGHEGVEDLGPEDVLWAKPHASREYTLLLGNGNDLITIDAAIQFRIRDPHAWLYETQNPTDALRAIGYRVVMRATVDRTLAAAMSENVATLAASIRTKIQADADMFGLGVEIVDFTIAGMHPPVAVAADYQAVVSAELGKVTAIVNAQAARNQSLPAAKSAALVATSVAQADGAAAIAKAAADAWSFRALQAQYTSARDEYRFRRRLEALEQVLVSRRFTIVDARIMRDGGELWLTR